MRGHEHDYIMAGSGMLLECLNPEYLKVGSCGMLKSLRATLSEANDNISLGSKNGHRRWASHSRPTYSYSIDGPYSMLR